MNEGGVCRTAPATPGLLMMCDERDEYFQRYVTTVISQRCNTFWYNVTCVIVNICYAVCDLDKYLNSTKHHVSKIIAFSMVFTFQKVMFI